MTDTTQQKPNPNGGEVFKGENNEPHHMNNLTDSAINPGAVLKAEVELPADQRFTVKKEFGASQVISTERGNAASEMIARENDSESSETIYRTNESSQDQIVQSGTTVVSSKVAYQQADDAPSGELVQALPHDGTRGDSISGGQVGNAEPIPVSEAELREQAMSKVDQMLEEAKRRGENMEAVVQKAEQLMSRVKSMSDAMKVDDALKERIRQTMLRTHQLRRRVTKAE